VHYNPAAKRLDVNEENQRMVKKNSDIRDDK
jgi:hypothetical protein